MNRILFSKLGRAKYISHLDLMRTMQRAMLRAGLEIKHTQGFNPHPHMVFALPLPVGCESVCELMDFELVTERESGEIIAGLNRTLPEGIEVTECYIPERKFKELAKVSMRIEYVYDKGIAAGEADRLRALFSREELTVNKKTKKGFADINILPLMENISLTSVDDNRVRLEAVIAAMEPSLNPLLITAAINKYAPELEADEVSYFRKEIYDKNMQIFR